MKYADLNTDGTVKGFYDDSLHETIPPGAIEISDVDWITYLENQSTYKFVNGILTSYIPVVIIPDATSITNKQGRLQFIALGKYALVQPAIDALPSPQKEMAQVEYDQSPTWSITDTTILSLMGALGIADTDLQTLFNDASKL